MKKLTIIIPAYNSERYIEKCIFSILKQTYTNLEIIIIDDNSMDNTYDICKKIEKNDARVKIIRNIENKGVSISRNIGINVATGEYMTFVDADDYIEEDMYEILINRLENEKVDIAMCNFFTELNGKDTRAKKEDKEIMVDNIKMLNDIFLSDYFCGFVWNKIYKADIIKKNNLRFDNNIFICEDLLFNCQYISKIKKGYYTTRKMYYYVQRINSSYNTKYNDRWKTVIQAYEKIALYVNKDSVKNFQYSYLYSLLNLKEKIYMSQNKDKELLKEINQKINKNKIGINKNKDLSKKTKMKTYIKIHTIRCFILLKKIKYFIIKRVR